MDTDFVLQAMDAVLPDEKIIKDCRAALKERASSDAAPICVKFDEEDVYIPLDTEITVVVKILFKEYYAIKYQTSYRTLVAIGGIQQIEYGIVEARYCFATLYHTPQSEFISIDFHKEM